MTSDMKKNSNNKPQTLPNVQLVNLSADSINIPTYTEKVDNSKGYVMWGKKNEFPAYLFDLYLRSAILQALVNGIADYVTGDAILLNDNLKNFEKYQNSEGDTIEDIVRKMTVDYIIYGGFAASPTFDVTGKMNGLYWIDYGKHRKSKKDYDEAGHKLPTTIFYCNDWSDRKAKVVEREQFTGKNREGAPIFVYDGHITRGEYAVPTYVGALKAIETGAQIQEFHLRNITNGFSASSLITFCNGVPSEEVQGQIKRKIEQLYTGAENAGDFVLTFSEDKEHAPIIEKIQDDGFDKKYEQLETSTMKSIFIAFRAQPQLFGFVIEGSMFNKEEYDQAYALFNKTVVAPMQRDLQRAFDVLFGMDNSITFAPFALDALNTDQEDEISAN